MQNGGEQGGEKARRKRKSPQITRRSTAELLEADPHRNTKKKGNRTRLRPTGEGDDVRRGN